MSGLSSFGEECSVAQYVKAPGLESFRVEHGALADDNLINGAIAFVRFKQIWCRAVCFKPWRKAVGEAFGRSQIGMVARIFLEGPGTEESALVSEQHRYGRDPHALPNFIVFGGLCAFRRFNGWVEREAHRNGLAEVDFGRFRKDDSIDADVGSTAHAALPRQLIEVNTVFEVRARSARTHVKIDLQICRKIDVGGINGAVVDGSRRNALQIDGAEAWETRAKGLFRGGFKTLLKWVPYGKAEEVDKGSGAVHEAKPPFTAGRWLSVGIAQRCFQGRGRLDEFGMLPS